MNLMFSLAQPHFKNLLLNYFMEDFIVRSVARKIH